MLGKGEHIVSEQNDHAPLLHLPGSATETLIWASLVPQQHGLALAVEVPVPYVVSHSPKSSWGNIPWPLVEQDGVSVLPSQSQM